MLNVSSDLKVFCFHFHCVRFENNAIGQHMEFTVTAVKVAALSGWLRSSKNATAV